jgi:hypothetical protein
LGLEGYSVSAAKALASAEAAGIRFSVTAGGDVQMVAKQPPPPGLVVELRRWKADVALLLATRHGYLSRLAARQRNAIAEAREFWTAPHVLAEMVAAGIDPGEDVERISQRRLPSWADAALTPLAGDWCSCCGRSDRQGGRWWRTVVDPVGWQCATCHPPPGKVAVITIAT